VEVGLADCLDPQRLEISESLLDHALSLGPLWVGNSSPWSLSRNA
jgi:hypothetical protein